MVEDDDQERPSKSQLKRDMHALQELGERLVDLPPSRLSQVEMPQNLRDAIQQARSITARGGRKRQLQFIGKLMRQVDADPIRQALARFDGHDNLDRAQLQQAERWRDRLLDEGDSAIEELFNQYPGAERQHLRRLVRDSIQELAQDRPPKHRRELFRALRTLFEGGS